MPPVLPPGQKFPRRHTANMPPTYRVRHWNSLDFGGAYNGLLSVHRALREAGVDSRIQVRRQPVTQDPSIDQLPPLPVRLPAYQTLARKFLVSGASLSTMLRKRGKPAHPRLKTSGFADSFLGLPTPPHADALAPDYILHLHWVIGMVDYPSFFPGLPANKPLVWTLHDYAPATGGCHYTAGCSHFTRGCGNCHYQPRPSPRDASAVNFRLRQKALSHLENLHIVGNSDDVTNQARRSPLFAKARSFQTIYYSTDLETFSPRSREAVRAELGIPREALAISFGAVEETEWRKGGDLLDQALAHLVENPGDLPREIYLLSFGTGEPSRTTRHGRLQHWHYGYLNPAELSNIYNASDIVVMPSREEAFGQVAMEGMACGVPVVAFRVGGVPDFVLPGENGFLAEPEDISSLAEALRALGRDPKLRARLGARGREMAEVRFSRAVQAAAYQRLYALALDIQADPKASHGVDKSVIAAT